MIYLVRPAARPGYKNFHDPIAAWKCDVALRRGGYRLVSVIIIRGE